MKTNCFHKAAMLVSLAVAAPFAMAQKPATDIPKAGETSPNEGNKGAATEEIAPGTEKTTPIPGRPASQPGRPDGPEETGVTAPAAVITGLIASNPSFSTFRQAVAQAGLEATLSDKNANFTIFAPTDSAFDKLPAGTLGKLMMPENKSKLRSLLLYHVVSGKMTAAEVKSGDVKTMNGETLKVAASGNRVQVQDVAVATPDMMATNGVIHSVNTVLIPKSLEGFADLSR